LGVVCERIRLEKGGQHVKKIVWKRDVFKVERF